jgi:hypothetical protein
VILFVACMSRLLALKRPSGSWFEGPLAEVLPTRFARASSSQFRRSGFTGLADACAIGVSPRFG